MKFKIAVKYSRIIYVLAIALYVSGEVRAQDPHFSQYYANPIYTNPAFAGGSYVGRVNMNYRSQWPSISGTFRTFSASYDEHFDNINGGIGFIASYDEAGVGNLATTTASLVYSYQIIINKDITMRAGLEAGFFQKAIDFNKFQFYDQIALGQGIVRPTGEAALVNKVFSPNFSAGTVIYSKSFYAGFAVNNLTTPKQGFFQSEESRLTRRYTVHGGLVIPHRESRDPKKASSFYPNILYMQQGTTAQLNLGMYYNAGPIVFGGYYRQTKNTADAIILLIGIKTPKVKLGFSYDATLSEVYYGAKQSYEVSLSFELKKSTPKRTSRNIRCPEF